MKALSLMVLVIVINFIVSFPSWADTHLFLANNPSYFEVGQKVFWLYKARSDSADIQKISAEVVKLSSKQVQIKVRKNNQFINRWVNPNRLEGFSKMKP